MSKKVLLADDSVTIQKVVEIILADDDYALHVADNGDTALAMAQTDRPDIILADVYMPGKNGYELCAAVKQEPALSGVPVLLLSGTFEAFDESKALAVGADGWIAKPFESMALIEQIDGALARSVSPAPLPETGGEIGEVQEPSAVEPDMWADLGEDTLAPESTEEFLAEATVGENETIDEVELEADDLWDDEPLLGQDEDAPVVVEEKEDEQDVSMGATDFNEINEVDFANADLAASDVAGELPEEEVLFLDESDLLIEDDVPSDTAVESDTIAEEETFEFVTIDEASQPETSDEPVGAFTDELSDESEMFGSVAEPVVAEEPVPVIEEEPVPIVEEEPVPVAEEEPVPVAEEEPAADILPEPEFSNEPDFVATSAPIEEPVAAKVGGAVNGLNYFSNSSLISSLASKPEPKPEPIPETEDVFAAEPEPIPETEDVFAAEPEPIPETEDVFAAEPEPASETEDVFADEPDTRTAALSKEDVADRVQGLSEQELTAIVEQVAGKVIERLANTMLERIAWEVVPDLAESLIKQEISRITAAQD